MKKFWLLSLMQFVFLTTMYCQKIDFTLKYNAEVNTYEVYALPNFSQEVFFVGGGSQLSLVLPSDIPNIPLLIETVAGGPWLDNSQIYAPEAQPDNDFHGIASNGSRIKLEKEKAQLLFTFQIPEVQVKKAIRLFENKQDPQSSSAGMGGGDFNNYFACALTMQDAYRKNYYDGLGEEHSIADLKDVPYTKSGASSDNEGKLPVFNGANPFLTEELTLFQNEPNPFTEKTLINFYLPQDEAIELSFKDEAGRLIKLVRENRKAGFNQYQFENTDLNSGLILYQLKTKSGTVTKKMLRIH